MANANAHLIQSKTRFSTKLAEFRLGGWLIHLLAWALSAAVAGFVAFGCGGPQILHLNLTAPASATAGTPFSVTVTAVDHLGATIAGYTGTVAFTSSDGAATLPASYQFTRAAQGAHTFTHGVTLATSGQQSIKATDNANHAIGGANVNVAGTVAQFKVSAPSAATAGSAFSVTVTAEDAAGNVVTSYAGTVHFTSSDGSAILPADYPFVASDAGVHTFTNGFTLETVGSQTITATDTVTGTIKGSSSVSVSSATAVVTQFLVSAPATTNAGVAFSVTVTAADSGGNTVPTYTGTAHFTSSDSSAVLPGDYTFTGADLGKHTFNNGFTLNTQGSESITATDKVTSTITGSASLTVQPPVLKSIAVTPSSATITVGSTQQFTAKGTYSDGSTQTVTAQANWTSNNMNVATVSNASGSQGLATSVNVGSANITATIGAVAGSGSLQLNPKSAAAASRYQLSLGISNIYVDAIVPSTGQLRAVDAYNVGFSVNYNLGLLAHPNGQVVYLVSIPSLGLEFDTFSISASGMLTPVGSPVLSQSYMGTPIIDPLGRFLYTEDGSGDIIVFPLDPNTGVPGTASNAATGVATPGLMAIDPSGTYMFLQTSGNIASYKINSTTGALTAVGSPVTAASLLASLAVTPSGKYLYALDSSNKVLYAYGISQGALTALTNSPFALPTGGSPQAMVMDPSGSFFYLAEQSTDALFGYTINADGTLTAMQSGTSFAVGGGPNLLTVDASGRFLYVNNRFSRDIWTYAIASGTGLLTTSSSIRSIGNSAQTVVNGSTGLAFTPIGMFLADEASGEVTEFNINGSTGNLSPMTLPAVGAGPNTQTVATDPLGQFAYVPDLGALTIPSYSISTSGLAAIAAPATGNGPSWATTDTAGAHLYVTMQTDNKLWGYDLSSGVPTNGQAIATTSAGPSFVTTEPSGQYLYVGDSSGSTGHIDVFSFGNTGLTTLVGTVTTGTSMKWIAVDPTGRFAYGADPADNLLWEFTISGVNGMLNPNSTPSVSVGTAASTPGPGTVAIEPSGKFLYAPNQSLNQIFGYSIDPSTGLLTPLASGTALATTGTMPVALGVDVSGKFLYCINQSSNDISIFTINSSTGALTQVGTSTTQAGGTQPYGFALTGTRN